VGKVTPKKKFLHAVLPIFLVPGVLAALIIPGLR
jgi:hypothetical protein